MQAGELLDIVERRILKEIRRSRKWAEENPEIYALTHEWLEQFCKGNGFDIACGNFPTILADGMGAVRCIDTGDHAGNFVNGYRHEGDFLPFLATDSCDFIVTNYFEGFPQPVKALNEWYRVLKPGAPLAMIISDAEAPEYDKPMGPFTNPRRLHIFTSITIRRYLERSYFREITVEKYLHTLRVKGVK